MRAAVSLVLVVSLLGCFPHNRRARLYSQIGEGVLLVGGVVLESTVKTGADCDQMLGTAVSTAQCHSRNSTIAGVGVGLILAGLLGFVVTISTAKEDPQPPKVDIKSETPKPADKPTVSVPIAKPPTPPPAPEGETKPAEPPADGSGSGTGSGSGSGSGSATP